MEKPLVTTIVLCDSIMREEVHGKHTLVGVFSSVYATKFPCYCGALCIFTALTNGRGKMPLELRCMNASTGEVAASIEKQAAFSDPNQILEIPFVLRGITFPEPGVYSFELRSDDELLAETRCKIMAPQEAAPIA
jgi:hypothetical protein